VRPAALESLRHVKEFPSPATKRPPAPSLTYAQWRERARAKLAGPTTMREKAWVRSFIIGKMPGEAAAEAKVHYGNSRAWAKR